MPWKKNDRLIFYLENGTHPQLNGIYGQPISQQNAWLGLGLTEGLWLSLTGLGLTLTLGLGLGVGLGLGLGVSAGKTPECEILHWGEAKKEIPTLPKQNFDLKIGTPDAQEGVAKRVAKGGSATSRARCVFTVYSMGKEP